MAVANVLDGLFVGDHGFTITITLEDEDGNAQNVSSYSGSQIVDLISPDGRKVVSCLGTYTSGGTDGVLTFSLADGDLDRDGIWKAQVTLNAATKTRRSVVFDVIVGKRLYEAGGV